MKTSEIFAKCIPLIQSGNFSFICHALCVIENAENEYSESFNQQWDLYQKSDSKALLATREIIANRFTLDHFLYHFNAVLISILDPNRNKKLNEISSKELRIEVLNQLIKDFESVGD